MTRKRSARTLASGVCVILFFAFQAGTELPARQDGAAPPGATRTLRLATLAPEGTEWADAARDAARRIREETGGRVELQWNLGAVMGDEASMMTRMREGTLEGGVFSMVGLTREVPPMVFMGLPFLFRDGSPGDFPPVCTGFPGAVSGKRADPSGKFFPGVRSPVHRGGSRGP